MLTLVGELREVARSLGAGSLERHLLQDVEAKLEADRFFLVVVGEFNHGKTALVNALLGEEVLPVGVTPTTAVLHQLAYADTPSARIVRPTGEVEEFPLERLGDFASGKARAGESAAHLEIGYPAEFLRERVVLVDTPGVNDLSLTRADITYGYLPRADAVLFVLDAGQPLKESEREFLEKQLERGGRDNLLFVINKSDLWTAEEQAEALTYVRQRLADLLEEPAVFAVSAKAARSGAVDSSGMQALSQQITQLLTQQRGQLVLGNAISAVAFAEGALHHAVEARRRAAKLSLEQLGSRIESLQRDLAGHRGAINARQQLVREETAAIKAWARRDLGRFSDDLLERLPGWLRDARGDDVREHLGAVLEHAFRNWAQAETDEISAALEGLAERVAALLREDTEAAGHRVGEALGREFEPPVIEVDTFMYDMGVFAVLSLGLGVVFANVLLGGVLLAAAPALALFTRERADAEIRKRAREIAPTVLSDTAAKVAPRLDQMVDDARSHLEEWIVSVGERTHRELIEVLERSREERQAGKPDSGQTAADCDQYQQRLASIRERIERLAAAPTDDSAGGRDVTCAEEV